MKGIIKLRACRIIATTTLISFMFYSGQSSNNQFTTSAAEGCGSPIIEKNYSYPEFENVAINPSSTQNSSINKIIHNAAFGLGHRLCKMSSAWHLTKKLNLTRLELEWNDCSGEGNIFPRLFGSSYIDVPGSEHRAALASQNRNKTIFVNNDVPGHFGALNFIKHQVPLPQKYFGQDSPFLGKLESDLQLYRILRQRFTGKRDVIRFMEEHKFREHFVIGLHLRLGNGESVHFTQLGRGVDNEMEFVYNLITLIDSFIGELRISHPGRFSNDESEPCQSMQKKAPLLFLATDSPKLIPFIVNTTELLGLKTVVMPQIRVESGVAFQLHSGEKCLNGWRDMLLDNILLSFSDVLIAARHSTFTQNLPMHLAFDRGTNTPGPHFCEVSDTAKTMTCLEDKQTWLFRDNPQKIFSYSLANDTNVAVVHRKTVELPDVALPHEFMRALSYLNPSNNATKRLTYGGKFNQKYRGNAVCPDCISFRQY